METVEKDTIITDFFRYEASKKRLITKNGKYNIHTLQDWPY